MEKEHAHLSQFIGSLKSAAATETLIGLVADSTGMLGACRNFVESLDEGDGERQAWLQQECTRAGVEPRLVLEQLRTVVKLFGSGDNGSDPYETLGLSRGASKKEIKYAYRALSLKYHPDTSSEGSGSEETFIRISRAYHQLTDKTNGNSKTESPEPSTHWRKGKTRTLSDSQRNQGVVIAIGLVIVLLIVSVIAAMNFRKRTMLSSLEQSRGAFVPPVESTVKGDLKSPYRSSSKEVNDRSQLVATKPSGGDGGGQGDYANTENQTTEADDSTKEDENASISTTEPQEIQEPYQQVDSPEGVSERAGLSLLDETTVGESGEPDPTINIDLTEEQPQEVNRLEMRDRDVTKPVVQKSSIPKPTVVRPVAQPIKKNIETSVKTQPGSVPDNGADSWPATTQAKVKQATAPATALVEPSMPTPTHPEPVKENDNAALVSETDIEPQNEQQFHEQVDVSSAEPAVLIEPFSPDYDIQTRVQSFIEEYVEAYEQGDIIKFSQLFMPDAVESGKPFVKRLSVYSKQFKKTKSASLEIHILHAEVIDGLIVADGRFTLNRVLYNGKQKEQGGHISFKLTELEGGLRVKKLSYSFEQKTAPRDDTAALLSEATIEPLNEQEPHVQVESGLKESTASIAPPSLDPVLQARVKSFMDRYTAAYEQGNIIQFSRLFMPDAIENGKPFVRRLSVYSKQFQNTENSSFFVTIFQAEEVNEQILLEGRFMIKLIYKSGRIFEGAGAITFVLIVQAEALRIQTISYTFDKS